MSDGQAFDVCVIGSGFAGSVIASELASTGKKIAIIEAGDWQDRQAVERDFLAGRGPVAQNPELHTPISVKGNIDWRRGWSYGVGGHTLWTAWAMRPLENHFKMRTLYGVGEDWPLTYDDLELHYCRAEDALGVSGDSANDHGPRRSRPYPMEAFPFSYAETQFVEACTSVGIKIGALPVARNRIARQGRDKCCFSGSCVVCPTTAKYRADLVHVPAAVAAKNVSLLTRHMALKLVLGEHGRIEKLVCGLPDKKTVEISAGVFVVACNTVESARLLLGSAQPGHETGLGNRGDVAGRYLMDHVYGGVGGVSPKPLWAARTAVAVLGRQFEDGPHRKDHAGFFVALDSMPALPTDVAIQSVGDGLFGVALKKELVRQVANAVGVGGHIEMLPVAANRVELDPSVRDFFDRPGMKVTMTAGEYEARGRDAQKAAVTPILKAMGCTEISSDDGFSAGFHQMGTLRMGKDPTRSVVDPNLRVHDVDNLFVASSAVYPTTLGPNNPTLTLVALSLRLADHLRKDVLR